jgi:hypothetical protein
MPGLWRTWNRVIAGGKTLSIQSIKSFYSYGQNKEETKWQVCLVDLWSDGTASMIIMAEFENESDAIEKQKQLQMDRDANL